MEYSITTIEKALSLPRSTCFWVSQDKSGAHCGNQQSFYQFNHDFEHLTFDISNTKVLVNTAVSGSIKSLTAYEGSYPVDSVLPGVWWFKGITQCGRFHFNLSVNGERYNLDETSWARRTSYLDNIFPCTEITGPGIDVTLLVYPPVSQNGEKLRGTFYCMYLKNSGSESLGLRAELVESPPERDSYIPTTSFLYQPDRDVAGGTADLMLGPGETGWLAFYIDLHHLPGELEQVAGTSSLRWLEHTWRYFRGMLGNLSISSDAFLHEFLERSVLQCLGSIGVIGGNEIAGANWGTYPATRPVWMKDMFYSFLPFYMLDTELLRSGILWFSKKSMRPGGRWFDGKITHSIVNALTPVVLSGLYFTSTGDKQFFTENPEIRDTISTILETLLAEKQSETWLFASDWISDVPALGTWHTGSNVIAWYSFKAAADILEHAYKEQDLARSYRQAARHIRAGIEEHCRKSGPFGEQYVEGADPDGSVPLSAHDGEESDVTLMPVYGYTEADSEPYRNFARFAFSDHNVYFEPGLRGIRCDDFMDYIQSYRRGKTIDWERYFKAHHSIGNMSSPCLVTRMAAIDRGPELFAAGGPLHLIRQHTDLNGSLWWWSYPGSDGDPRYGHPVRFHKAGTSAWAAGCFVAFFVSEVLGIRYNGLERRLWCRPLEGLGNYRWENLRYGQARFTVQYTRSERAVSLEVSNHNTFGMAVTSELALGKDEQPKSIRLNGREVAEETTMGRRFSSAILVNRFEIESGETTTLEATLYDSCST